ncbi:MAG: EAL domain-containing protein [Myxococcota bacterium]|nr:EAL domain-containing protein [Myxococcales bacterium]
MSNEASHSGNDLLLLGSYAEQMPDIAARFRERGAVGVVVADASALERVERGYGAFAHRKATSKLAKLVLEACSRELGPQDLVAMGEGSNDEIVVLLLGSSDHANLHAERLPALCEKLREAIAKNGAQVTYPYIREPLDVPVGYSIALYHPGLREERQVRVAVDRARADAQLDQRVAVRARDRRFLDLLLGEDVTILYEPIVSVETREVLGYEALVRGPWDSDLHSPGALFQRAEETGLLFELDCLCRRVALRSARGLEPGRKLFLNCLPTAIHDPAFRGDVLRRTLEDLRLRPSDVVFEISEKESIANFSIFREARDYYGELGFQIALDDTGVAYGSLEAVMELSPNFIKVDMSLVRGVDTDPAREELLRALHAVASKIDAAIIAEGIETADELAAIARLGIPYGQGYLFGRPAPLRRNH